MERTSGIEVYERLKGKLGEEETKLLLRYVDDTTRVGLATKEDVLGLEIKMGKLELSLREEMGKLELSLREEMGKLKMYLVGIAALIVLTNPRVIDSIGRVLGLVR